MKRKEKQLQEALKRFYEAPPPKEKGRFLEFLSQELPSPGPGRGSFLRVQAGYIGKWNWGISLAVLLAGIWAADSGSRELFQLIAAAVPFLALALAAETGRSARYGMEELELAARFSLKAVVAARMGILGIGNLLLLGILIPVWGDLERKWAVADRLCSFDPLFSDRLPSTVGGTEISGIGKYVRVFWHHSTGQRTYDPSGTDGGMDISDTWGGMGGADSPSGSYGSAGKRQVYQTGGGICMELRIDRLTKQYKNKIAVDRISLTLGPGVYGLLGANGAGKTTLMRMICGVLKPTGGTVTFQGHDVTTEAYRNTLGYLPQDFGYYPGFTGLDFLVYLGLLKGLEKPRAAARSRELLKLVGLEEMGKKKIRTYSGGMRQRLGIAQALLNRPKLLVLDEPTAGLDPRERVRFRNLIARLGEENVVILSTHIVSDVEQIADKILLMKEGQMIYSGSCQELGEGLEQFCMEMLERRICMYNFRGLVEWNTGSFSGKRSYG